MIAGPSQVAGVELPEGWGVVNLRLTHYLVIQRPAAGAVTIDLRFRCFRGGHGVTHGRPDGTARYVGRGWRQALVRDAIQWLGDVYAERGKKGGERG